MADNELCKPPLILPTLFFYIFSHPLYFSYFLFFSPYFFKFISLFSPLFFTTALLLILSVISTAFPASGKLGFVQAVVDHVRSKLKAVDEEEEYEELEVCDFEEFEIYKIVFRDVLITAAGEGGGDPMEEVVVVVEVLGKSEEEKSLERLFEELDRFEDFRDVIEVKEEESSSDLVEFVGELRNSEAVEKHGGKSMAEMEKFDGKSMAVTSDMEKFGGKSMEKLGGKSVAEMERFGDKSMEVTSETEKVGGESMAVATEMQKIGGKSTAVTLEMEKLGGKSMAEMEKFGGKSMAEMEKFGSKSMAEMEKFGSKSMAVTSEKLGNKSMAEMEKFSDKSTAVTAETTAVSGEDPKTVTDPFFVRSNSLRLGSCSSFGSSYGSMRKEKEWKRTLACKLFEERHNNSEGGEEGMDSLWEVHETDNSATKSKKKKDAMVKHKKSLTNKAKSEFKYFDDVDDEEEEDDDDEFMMSNGQLCCLKALKLSAGKMNLGMGKPNLVKISKALKGFGWLHHVGTKNAKRI